MLAMSPDWVVTRAQPDADDDVAALRAIGVPAVAVPCIERVALPWPQWNPPGPRVVLVTSVFGAKALVKAWPTLAEPRPKVAAMAPSTAARLEAAGIPVELRAEGGVVALAQALRAWHRGGPLAVLYATSDAGAQQAEQAQALAVMSLFATVERIAVYSTRAPAGLDVALGALPAPGAFIFMSPSAVENALACLPAPPVKVACIGQSTYRRFKQLLANGPATHYSSFSAFLGALTQERS